MNDGARTAALQALLRVDVDAGYSNLVLDKTIAAAGLSGRDASLTAAIFYGVLERRLTLDYYLAQFLKTPLAKLTPTVRELLRMGTYQVLYLDRVPDSAAVNESVCLARENGEEQACGFINGVLRALVRGRLALAPPEGNDDSALGVRYSCPAWLVGMWREAYGAETTMALLGSLAEKPPIYARVNTLRISVEALIAELAREEITAMPIEAIPGALRLENTGSIAACAAFGKGLFHVQDLSSQLCCALLGARPGERVIDVCAAPGGKSFTLAQHMEDRGEVLAFDKYKGKARLIAQGAERLGLTNVFAGMRDAVAPTEALEQADRVLCDAPCSGLGIIRRKPEIRYKEKHTLDSLPDLQYLILSETSKLVKPGATLIYSTCTLNPRENGDVAAKFLRGHAGFAAVPLALPKGFAHGFAEPEHTLTLMPHLHDTDGFYVAAFQKIRE